MTNEATVFPTVVFDERIMLPGHTLVLIAAVCVATAILVFGFVRAWQHRRTAEILLPRRLMFVTGISMLALAAADTLICIANALEIRATVSDPAAVADFFSIAIAQQLRFVCVPLLVSGIAFALAVSMGKEVRKDSPTKNRTVP